MSVLYPGHIESIEWLESVPPWHCTECGETVNPPLVYWRGGQRDLFFHATCAARLGPHLIADSREAELAGNSEQRWRTRAVNLIRHRLQIAEGTTACR